LPGGNAPAALSAWWSRIESLPAVFMDKLNNILSSVWQVFPTAIFT